MKKNLIRIEGTANGRCVLCNGEQKTDKELIVIRGPSFSGDVCPEHLLILAKQQAKKE